MNKIGVMTSNKPYFLRALYQWIVDNQCTPYLLAKADFPDVVVPEKHIDSENKITLNLSPQAIKNLNITQEEITFLASFSSETYHIVLPTPSVLAIYAAENGEGMMFEEEDPKKYLAAKKKQKTASSTLSSETRTAVPYLRIVEDHEPEEE